MALYPVLTPFFSSPFSSLLFFLSILFLTFLSFPLCTAFFCLYCCSQSTYQFSPHQFSLGWVTTSHPNGHMWRVWWCSCVVDGVKAELILLKLLTVRSGVLRAMKKLEWTGLQRIAPLWAEKGHSKQPSLVTQCFPFPIRESNLISAYFLYRDYLLSNCGIQNSRSP
jgi:hypothetical protein